MTQDRLTRMREILEARFQPTSLTIRDDSALHAGHAGAQGGAGHYALRIESEAFRGRRQIDRHRLVYDALAPLMPDQIHALSIQALTPGDD